MLCTSADLPAMTRTFGANAHSLATCRPEPPFGRVPANGNGSARHTERLRDNLPPAPPASPPSRPAAA